MNAAATDTRKEMTPVAQVSRRFPRQAAMKNLPQRWITMKKKKASTLHRWSEFTKCPVDETCHQLGPMTARTQPVTMTQTRLTTVSTPKT